MTRTLAVLAALLALATLPVPALAIAQQVPPPPPAAPPPPPPPAPAPPAGKMPHLRLYLGGAAANQAASGSGGAVLVGIQNYADILPVLQSYWGTELVGVQIGSVILPILGGDVGVRFTPFPDWFLRPYLRANLGVDFLVILPVPSAGLAIGVALPIFNAIFFDVAFGVRRVFNIFNASQSVDLAVVELSVGF